MIITKIQHGLGNQMFQYAIGRRMSERNSTDLKLDISQYENQNKNDTKRSYSLDCFNIKESFATKSNIKIFSAHNFSNSNILEKLIRKFFIKIESKKPIEERSYLAESKIDFKEKILENKNKNIYLYGGWQNEIYFKDIRNILLKEFTLKKRFGKRAKDIEEQIKNSYSISIHIRRGDYESNPKTKAYLGVLPKEYYERAIKTMTNKTSNPVFFVFSDDINWAKKELNNTEHKTVFVSNEQIDNCEELILMAKCNDNIIANSSFGWWGAWLNQNINKKVIAPKKWFSDPNKKHANPCPQDWIKI